MTKLINDAQQFALESLNGFVAANADRVRLVPGAGVVRHVNDDDQSRVAVVTGGGSGHYPAFLGWVGPGMIDGAVSGNIFSSPSASQVLSVARAAARGRSILFIPINYAGDILHFSEARDRLIAEGYDVRIVPVTDDIASGGADASSERRGIAGSFIVAKIVAAAVAKGADLDDVERVAREANDATRTLGLAFSGCTLPGAGEANFHVPDGQMALGLGIHGEPGLSMLPLTSADDAADILVDGLLQERSPVEGHPVAVLVNGLGSTKYDELNVVYGRVARRITDAGMTPVAPVVGELVTSLDMAGVSLSITYLTDELEELWRAPASSAAFTRASSAGDAEATPADITDTPAPRQESFPAASGASQALAAVVVRSLETAASQLAVHSPELARLDAIAGDGDHGACMERGSAAAHTAAAEATEKGAGAGSVLRAAGDAWADTGGGTSGALWGAGLRAAGETLGDTVEAGPGALRDAIEAFSHTISDRGGASPGDKTMLDAIVPFTSVFAEHVAAGADVGSAWHAAATAATEAAEATAAHAAKRGRARTHGDNSIGTPDPGATSFALLATALHGQFTAPSAGTNQ